MPHVSIIGGGNMGQAIATIVTKGGNTVEVFNSNDADKPVTGDVVFLAVPYPAVAGVLAQRGDQLADELHRLARPIAEREHVEAGADIACELLLPAPLHLRLDRHRLQRLDRADALDQERLVLRAAVELLVETFAEDTFNWAQQLLGDPEVSADPQRAAHVVACIARDEVPHVDYLTVALSELRTRTLISADGKTEFSGADVIDSVFRRQLRGMATQRPRQSRDRLRDEIRQAIADTQRASVVASRFEDLDSGWTFPHPDDEALDVLLTAA